MNPEKCCSPAQKMEILGFFVRFRPKIMQAFRKETKEIYCSNQRRPELPVNKYQKSRKIGWKFDICGVGGTIWETFPISFIQ